MTPNREKYLTDLISSLRTQMGVMVKENDELKAMVNGLAKAGNAMSVNLGYSDDTFAGGYKELWKSVKAKSPKQCLLEHDKRVLVDAANSVAMSILTRANLVEYAGKLGGEK